MTTVLAPVSRSRDPCACEHCGSALTRRIVSKPSVHLSKLSKVERMDPRYDKMVDQAMRNTQHADPDRLMNRRGDVTKGLPDKD